MSEATYVCQECGEAPATTKRSTPLFANNEVCVPCAMKIDREKPHFDYLAALDAHDRAALADRDACDALKLAEEPANTLVIQLAVTVANARTARWPQPELDAVVEALRAALIAKHISFDAPRPTAENMAGVDFAAAAVDAAEPWIRNALLGCDCSMQRTKTKPSRLVHMPSCPARDAL